jgi:hypothetical protein
MLSVFLACEDPYDAASSFVEKLGWRLAFATPHDSDDRRACVALGDAEVMLGTAEEQYLPAGAREHRGAGVITTTLSMQPWGERAFDAVIAGYRFLIAEEAAR